MRAGRMALAGLAAALLLTAGRTERSVPAAAGAEIREMESRYAALTFDDGPRPGVTDMLLDGLRARGASATFFLIGEQIEGNEALLRRMREEGHQIGNHTWSHADLERLSPAALSEEVGRTDAAIRAAAGDGCYWVRPPYGLLQTSQRALFSTPLIHWSVDPEDWKLKNTQKVTAAVLKAVKPGSIILLHDSHKSSAEAALQIVDALEAEGYEFVTVEELLALYGNTPQNGKFYTDAFS